MRERRRRWKVLQSKHLLSFISPVLPTNLPLRYPSSEWVKERVRKRERKCVWERVRERAREREWVGKARAWKGWKLEGGISFPTSCRDRTARTSTGWGWGIAVTLTDRVVKVNPLQDDLSPGCDWLQKRVDNRRLFVQFSFASWLIFLGWL